MLRVVIGYGLIAGLLVSVNFFWVLTSDPASHTGSGYVYGYATMIIALTAVFLGIKHYRDKALGGVIRFGQAVLVGLGISAVASLIYVVGCELCLALSGMDFGSVYGQAMVDAARQKGASGAELEKVVADAQAFAKSYANPLYRMPMTFIEIFPVGLLITLISAAVLRNSRVLPARRGVTVRVDGV
jgi:hypothetical protein